MNVHLSDVTQKRSPSPRYFHVIVYVLPRHNLRHSALELFSDATAWIIGSAATIS